MDKYMLLHQLHLSGHNLIPTLNADKIRPTRECGPIEVEAKRLRLALSIEERLDFLAQEIIDFHYSRQTLQRRDSDMHHSARWIRVDVERDMLLGYRYCWLSLFCSRWGSRVSKCLQKRTNQSIRLAASK